MSANREKGSFYRNTLVGFPSALSYVHPFLVEEKENGQQIYGDRN